MSKYIITVRSEDEDWLWSSGDWKDCVCQDFDEKVVLIENRDYNGTEEAPWWTDAKSMLDDFGNISDVDEAVDLFEDTDSDKVRDAWKYYENSKDGYNDTVIKIAKILYPWIELKSTQLTGYHTYQNAVYLSDSLDVNTLQDWWSGDVYDVRVYEVSDEDIIDIENDELSYDDVCDINTETDGMYFTGTELYKAKRNPEGYKAGMAEAFGIPVEDIYDIEEGT